MWPDISNYLLSRSEEADIPSACHCVLGPASACILLPRRMLKKGAPPDPKKKKKQMFVWALVQWGQWKVSAVFLKDLGCVDTFLQKALQRVISSRNNEGGCRHWRAENGEQGSNRLQHCGTTTCNSQKDREAAHREAKYMD